MRIYQWANFCSKTTAKARKRTSMETVLLSLLQTLKRYIKLTHQRSVFPTIQRPVNLNRLIGFCMMGNIGPQLVNINREIPFIFLINELFYEKFDNTGDECSQAVLFKLLVFTVFCAGFFKRQNFINKFANCQILLLTINFIIIKLSKQSPKPSLQPDHFTGTVYCCTAI